MRYQKRILMGFVNAFVLMAIALMGRSAFAGINVWTKLGPEGGQVVQIEYNRMSPSVVYMTAASGFHRSTDGGLTWQMSPINSVYPDPQRVSVDPSNPDRIYTVFQKPYLSTDAGKTFHELPAPPGVGLMGLGIGVGADGTVYVANQSSVIFRSVNQGQTWEQRGTVTASSGVVLRVVVDPQNPNRIYVPTREGLYESTDAGLSWVLLGQVLGDDLKNVRSLTIDPQVPSRIWVVALQGAILFTSDYGLTWATVYPSSTHSANWPAALVLNPVDSDQVYIGLNDGKILRTTNQGSTWTQVADRGEPLTTFAINPSKDTDLLAGSQSGVAEGSLSGATWTPRNTGLIATTARQLVSIKNQNRIYFMTNMGVNYVQGGVLGSVDNIALKSVAPELVGPFSYNLFGAGGSLFVTNNGNFAKSLDGGSTWFSVTALSSGSPFAIVEQSSPNPMLYAATFNGVQRSVDGGLSWADRSVGLPLDPQDPSRRALVWTLAKNDISSAIYAAAGSLYKTTNNGQTWVAANSGISDRSVFAVAVDPVGGQTMYAGTYRPGGLQTIAKSTDGGGAWVDVLQFVNPSNWFLSIKFDHSNSNIVYAMSRDSVFRSVNGGQSWQMARPWPTSGAMSWGMNSLELDPQLPNTLLVGTDGDGIQQLTLASDLALTMNAPSFLANGAQSTYVIAAKNQGQWDVTDARVTVQLPESVSTVSATSATAACSTSGSTVTCTIPVLRVNAVASVSVTATPSALGVFQASASIEGTMNDLDSSNDSASNTQTVMSSPPQSNTSGGSGGGGGGGSVSWVASLLFAIVQILRSLWRMGSRLTGVSMNGTLWSNGAGPRVRGYLIARPKTCAQCLSAAKNSG